MDDNYNWIVERARSGEAVPIYADRPDFDAIIDFLTKVDGRGLTIQSDTDMIWIVRSEPEVKL